MKNHKRIVRQSGSQTQRHVCRRVPQMLGLLSHALQPPTHLLAQRGLVCSAAVSPWGSQNGTARLAAGRRRGISQGSSGQQPPWPTLAHPPGLELNWPLSPDTSYLGSALEGAAGAVWGLLACATVRGRRALRSPQAPLPLRRCGWGGVSEGLAELGG